MDSIVRINAGRKLSFKSVLGFLCLAISLCIGLLGSWDEARAVLGMMLIACSLYLLVFVRRNVVLFVICFVFFYSNYSAVIANIFPPYSSFDTMYAASSYSAEALLACSIFISVLLLFIPSHIAEMASFDYFSFVPRFRYRAIATLMLSVVLVAILLSGLAELANGGRASTSSLFEYAYILLSVGFILSGNSKASRNIFIILSVFYIVQPMLGGNRANMLNVVLLLFVIFFARGLTWKSVLPALLLGALFLISFGNYRSSDNFSIVYVASQMGDAFKLSVENSFIWDTASFAFQQCIAFIDLKDEISSSTLLYLIGQWVQSWFLGSSAVPDSSLAMYVQERVGGLGGGFLPVYFYFYFGVPGAAISGLIVAFWFRRIASINQESSPAAVFLTVGIAATVCRWYLYSPAAFTSSLFFSSVICAFLSLFIEGFLGKGKETEEAGLINSHGEKDRAKVNRGDRNAR